MSIKDFGKKALNHLYNKFADDMPKFAAYSTIAGWVLAVASNVFGVTIDKKIDSKEKKYLIPREIGDGAANIALFLAITMPLVKAANKIVDSGKIAFKDGIKPLEKESLKSGLGVGASLLGAVVVSNIIAPVIRNVIATKSQKKAFEKQNGTVLPISQQNSQTTIAQVSNPISQNSLQAPVQMPMKTFMSEIHSTNLRV